MLKTLFHLLLLSVFFYYSYRVNEFVKSFTFASGWNWFVSGEYADSELKENNQLENDYASFYSPSETAQKNANKNEDILELNNFYDKVDLLCQSRGQKSADLVKSVDNYVQRYISLFLITSNLQEYKVTDGNEEITFDLEISISGEDLAYLQDYSKNSKSSPNLKNLSKLDRIFSRIARAKERSYMESAWWFSKSFLARLIFSIISQPSFQSVIIFLLICAAIWTFLLFCYKHLYFCLGIIINSTFIWEGLQKYWRKLREADVEDYLRTLRIKSKDCDPSKSGWYDSFVNFFSGDPCLQYYKDLHKSSVDDVSLFKCIIDIYSFYLIELPVKLFGTSVRDITGEISTLWPRPVRFLINLPLVVIIFSLAGFFVLILFGKRLRLSFFGAAVEIGDAAPKPVKENVSALLENEASGTFRIIRRLKPWTKPRVPKRLQQSDLRPRKILQQSTNEIQDGKNCNAAACVGTDAAKED